LPLLWSLGYLALRCLLQLVLLRRRSEGFNELEIQPAASALAPFAESAPHFDPEALQVTAAIRPGTRLMDVVRALDSGGVEAIDLHRREATLDDVFLTLTKTEPSRPMEVAA